MKTPDEIKKGLAVCATLDGDCENCPYDDGKQLTCVDRSRRDALAYIIHLESRLAKIQRERDVAVHDVRSLCATNYFSGDYCEYCKYREPDGQCFHDCTPYSSEWGWEWRGVCAENTKEE